MPQKEIDIIINDRDIEQSEKKLRSMDRLLQQTQRRAAVLGRTRMMPVISLNDRFSTKARLITHRMTLLDRMSANPIVWLIDNASARIYKIRDSLVQLTRTPWRVAISGLNGDVAKVSKVDCTQEKQRQTNRNKIPTMFPQPEKNSEPKKGQNFPETYLFQNYRKWPKFPGTDLFKDSGQEQKIPGTGLLIDFGKNLLTGLIDDKVVPKVAPGALDALKNNRFVSRGIDIAKNGISGVTAWASGRAPGALDALRNNRFLLKGTDIAKSGLKWGKKIFGPVGTAVGIMDIINAKPGKERYGKIGGFIGGALLGALGSVVGTIGGPVGAVAGGAALGTAGGLLGEKVGGFIYGSGSEIPEIMWEQLKTPRTEINGKPVKDMGFFEPWIELGKEGYNALTNKEAWQNIGDMAKSIGDSIITGNNIQEEFRRRVTEREQKAQGGPTQQATPNDFSTNPNYILDPIERIKQNHEIFKSFNPMERKRTNQIINGNKSTNLDSSVQFPTNQSRVPRITSNDNKQKVDNSVNVSVAPGAINLTIQKDEINYDEIAQKAGGMIANQVRFAMMNMS